MERLPVLLIIDDTDMARLVAEDIDAQGYQAVVATSVGDALRLIARQSYSAVVADYFGPRDAFPYRWPILQLLARFAPQTPVLALSMLREVPKSNNLAAIVPLPNYGNDLAKGLKRYALKSPENSRDLLLARYLAALWEGDADEATAVVSEAAKSGWSEAAIYEGLFAPALYEIGVWWAEDSCTVVDEHGARVTTERLMSDVSSKVERRAPVGRRIMVACVENERHELGARMVADLFTWDGWTVRLVGADPPATELVSEARKRPVDVVALSATMQPSWESIRFQIAALRAAGTKAVIVGGQAFHRMDERAVAALGADAKAERALGSVELAGQLLGQARNAVGRVSKNRMA